MDFKTITSVVTKEILPVTCFVALEARLLCTRLLIVANTLFSFFFKCETKLFARPSLALKCWYDVTFMQDSG